ncbi:hypothetical protein ACFYOT_37990 [Saccharothrix saharensis]|uniref:hypothetical protein n=1 Tax=Saccharothrix saharensis TaxID=571190 RepID=UPI0036A80BD7
MLWNDEKLVEIAGYDEPGDARQIDDRGRVAVQVGPYFRSDRVYVWHNGSTIDLPVYTAGKHATPHHVNNTGTVLDASWPDDRFPDPAGGHRRSGIA